MNKEILNKLIELIKIDSFAYKKAEVSRAHNFVKEYLKNINVIFETHKTTDPELAPFLVIKSKRWNKHNPVITLIGHIDIVFPDISDFKVKQTKDKLFGPGAVDMKAGIVVMLETIKTLDKLRQLENVLIVITSDEEHFRTDAYPDLANFAKISDYILVYEGSGSLEKKPDFKSKTLVTSRKGVLFYKLKATGPGGHSGVLDKSHQRHSAIHELLAQSNKMQNFTNYDLGTTVNIGLFNGGEAVNILSPEAEMGFDVRMKSIDEFKKVEKTMNEIKPIDEKIQLDVRKVVVGSPVEESESNKNLFELAKKAGKSVGLKIEKETRSGASDMNRMAYFDNTPAMIDFMGPSGGGEHTKNEFLYLDSFEPSLNLSIELVKEIKLQNQNL